MGRTSKIPKHTLHRVGENLYRNGHGVYFGWIFQNRKQVKRSLKTRNINIARQKLAVLRSKIGRISSETNLDFATVAHRWLDSIKGDIKPSSHERRVTSIRAGLTPGLGSIKLKNLSRGMIDEKWKNVRSPELSARSYNIEKETLNLVLKYAESHGYILENPAVALKRRTQQKKIPEIPTKEQFKSLVDQLRLDPRSTQAADWVEFAGYSGTRIDEARNVTWSDVDFKADTIRITGDEETGTKNSRQRITPLFPALRAFLEARSGQSDATNLLFPRRTARGTGKTKWTPKQAIASACKKAGLPRFTPHHLRHFFCSNAIEAGIDFKTIAAWLGHQDGGVLVATTYGHLRAEHSIEMARKMTYSATPIPLPELGTTDNSAASTL